jgi:Fe-S-cluster containining protein
VHEDAITGCISAPAGAVRVSAVLPILRTLADASIEAATRAVEVRGQQITCREGCGACCRLLVLLPAAEASALAKGLEGLTPDHRARVLERFDAALDRLAKAGLLERLAKLHELDREARTAISKAYWQAGIECPFLERERCSIYEQRPLACREHLVTSPFEQCLEGTPERVDPGWFAGEALGRWCSAQMDPSHVPLPLLLAWARRHPEAPAHESAEDLLRAIARSDPRKRLDISAADMHEALVHSEVLPSPGDRIAMPDYECPDALMIPHGTDDPGGLLSQCAVTAAQEVGVILLTTAPAEARAFVERQPVPRRYSIVTAEMDTGWIRDRAPFPVTTANGCEWILPRVLADPDQRPADTVLFEKISARPPAHCPRFLSGGNLVAGPQGLAFSTLQVLAENNCQHVAELHDAARLLGIRRWILFAPFHEELSGHADVHVRCLAPDLFAVAWSRSREDDRMIAEELQAVIETTVPGACCLRIPMRSDGSHYASPVNWVQLGRALLVPRFPMTPQEDVDEIEALLGAQGFQVRFLHSPTQQFGGSLHCLTASIYADAR